MTKNYDVVEVTKENQDEYLSSIVQLENLVLDKMEKEGKVGQLFITGEEGIKEYIESSCNHVLVAVKDGKQVISAAYITQGQIDFTYNDVTKYFKCDPSYQSYIKSKYSREDYASIIRKVYIEKISAFKYARDVVLQEYGIANIQGVKEQERNTIFLKLVQQELDNPESRFDEKSKIREELNKYMSLYMKRVKKNLQGYQDFYWVDLEYLKQNLGKFKKSKISRSSKFDSTIETYDKVLQLQKYLIHDKTNCKNNQNYYKANTANTVELDTYITHPDNREKGIARILVLEGIKKSLNRLLKNPDNKEVFLVSTLHQDNLSSKYVSEFFGLKDYLFVNRRTGRDRQVHIYGMKKEDVPNYIEQMEKKVAVLYGYNPSNIKVSEEERRQIIQEQIKYETDELNRLNSIKRFESEKKYKGYIKCKENKIQALQKLVDSANCNKKKNTAKGNSYKSDGIEVFDLPSDFELEL